MAYMALYREFRPQKFCDVIGQEHITETIKRQVETGRVAHAYLFSGGRGSGKTTTAKILSRVVNCLNPMEGEPCNECEICKGALDGSLTDITEIDAASNNGVDNIRDIRDEVQYLPTRAKYRVYIIDEVHMLSTGAFNALLKTLEEPPAHVIFILATTEPQKLPVTILSRCQRFDFKRISIQNICMTLKKCVGTLNIQVEDEALIQIAKMADGAMRDAYSILDRCIADGETVITESKIRELVGIPEFELLYEFTKLILANDTVKAIDFMEKIIFDGKNLEVFLIEIIKLLRDILVFKVSNINDEANENKISQMQELSTIRGNDELIYLISKLSELQNEMKWNEDAEITFETGIIRAMVNLENAVEKIKEKSTLNQQIAKSSTSATSTAATGGLTLQSSSLKNKLLTKLKENSKMRLSSILSSANIFEAEDGIISVAFETILDDMTKAYLKQEDTKMTIKEVAIECAGREVKVKYVFR